MYIIAKTNYEKLTVILLPKEATEGAYALFARKSDDAGNYDVDNAVALNGDEGELDGGRMVYRFNSEEFMKALLTYDALVIMYLEEGGIHESAMVRLEELQKLIKQVNSSSIFRLRDSVKVLAF